MLDTSPHYEELQFALAAAGSVCAASECHGMVVGQLCAAPRFEPLPWLRHIFGGELPASDEVMACSQLLAGLAKTADRQLKADDVQIELFLPQEAPLVERSLALAEWCQGFILGISMAGLSNWEALPSESKEFVEDLTKVAHGNGELDGSEEDNEEAYAEIVEYVRVGALVLREDLLFSADQDNG